MNLPNNNICTFVPHSPRKDLTVLHFVYETTQKSFDKWISLPFYQINYVIAGKGALHTSKGEFELSEGDVFICLPNLPYAIESKENFIYSYVSFLGSRATESAYRFKINEENCTFKSCDGLRELWVTGVNLPQDLSEIYAEGLILCTLANIGRCTVANQAKKRDSDTPKLIKKYIDENFTSQSLCLSKICEALSYDSKYISRLFKKSFGVSFKEYLNTVRLNNARALFDKGYSSVKEVSMLCGYSDPLYFSKLFKEKHGASPSDYARALNKALAKTDEE